LNTQGIFNYPFSFIRSELQDLQVVFICCLVSVNRLQHVVRDSELAGGKHLFAIAVLSERSWLANQ